MTDPDPDPDLDAMSLQDLKQLQKDVAKAIATYEERGKSEARSKLDALAREMGYSLADLTGGDKKATRGSAPAKYRHPENPSLTWSGRGRKPAWFAQVLDAGTEPETMMIR